MSSKTFAALLKIVIIGAALCLAFVYAVLVPEFGRDLATAEFACLFTPWLVIIELTALPIIAALVLAWIISTNIGHERTFCLQNARLLAVIAVLAFADAMFFFIASMVVMFVTKVWHPGVVIFILLACFVGVAVSIAAAALSHYAKKGAELQEQSDLTI